jgi:hypothetical protein
LTVTTASEDPAAHTQAVSVPPLREAKSAATPAGPRPEGSTSSWAAASAAASATCWACAWATNAVPTSAAPIVMTTTSAMTAAATIVTEPR